MTVGIDGRDPDDEVAALDAACDRLNSPDLLRQRRGAPCDLDAWLIHYNTERPHLGYGNMGRRPLDIVLSFVSQEG